MTPMSRDTTVTGQCNSYHCSTCDYHSRGRRRLQATDLSQQASSSNNGSVYYMAP